MFPRGDGGEPDFYAQCFKCGAESPSAATELEAAAEWNKRHSESADNIDTASIALSQAHAILDLLTASYEGLQLPETYPAPLEQATFAAMSEIDRAYTALLGSSIK